MATLSIRIPDSLHKSIKEFSSKDGYTMNQFILTAAAEKLAALGAIETIEERASRASLLDARRLLDQVPNNAPDQGDEL